MQMPDHPSAPRFDPLCADGAFILGFAMACGRMDENGLELSRPQTQALTLLAVAERTSAPDAVTGQGERRSLCLSDPGIITPLLAWGIGNKPAEPAFPPLPPDRIWPFIAGYFEGMGGELIPDPREPRIRLQSPWPGYLCRIAERWGVRPPADTAEITASGYRALDICGKMYERVSFQNSPAYEAFTDMLNWEPIAQSGWHRDLCFKCKKLDPCAVIPEKKRVTDSGYDIYAVRWERDPKTGLYVADMRLAVEPAPGYYFDMVGRSSLPRSGFLFAGGVGIIDRGYVGSLKMHLYRFDPQAPVPALPFCCGQLIPRRIVHLNFVEVTRLSASDRGAGGFGSTG